MPPARLDTFSKLAVAALAVWAGVHALHIDRFLFHDSWKHIFPTVYRIATSGACLNLPAWLGTVDNGSPTSIYALSFSLTHLPRIAELYLLSCLDLSRGAAIYSHKVQIFVSWALFSAGMFVLGRLLFNQRASAVYLFVATLFAGACLDASHSDQIVSELFWIPWLSSALLLWHRKMDAEDGPRYLNIAVLIFGVSLLDHYPHLIALAAALAGAIYAALNGRQVVSFFRNRWRKLGPALAVMATIVFQLLIVMSALREYSPSLRQDLVVHPSQFGTTGFVQPTAIVAFFFPLSFMVEYDKLFITLPLYIFKLDLLIFWFGAIPLFLFFAAFLSRRTPRTVKIGWGLFAALIVAVALQQTRLYYLIFHLPLFNVFRGYFLFSIFIVFATLVLSAYGFDAVAAADPSERRMLTRRTALWFIVTAAATALVFAWLLLVVPDRLQTLRRIALPFAFDAAMLAGAVWLVGWGATVVSAEAWSRRILIGLVVLQLPLVVGGYRLLAISGAQLMGEYGLREMSVVTDSDRDDGTGPVRQLCTRYAQCYLSTHRTVSLNLDLEATFLRHKEEPVFQPGLARAAQEALSGLTHPDVWLSRQIAPSPSKEQLIREMNALTAPGGSGLTMYSVTLADQVPSAHASKTGEILRVARRPDLISATYRADVPQILNVAVNFDPAWRAKVGGRVVPPMKVNFGGMAVPVPAGESEVIFEYRHPLSEFFFLSRYALVLLALLSAVFLLGQLRRQPSNV